MGDMTHLDSSESFFDCAGETLVRSVDPGLLVGGRADLGKENFQFIESSSFNLNAWINLAAETHFNLCTNTIINNGLNWIGPSKVKVVKESVSSQYQYFQMIADLQIGGKTISTSIEGTLAGGRWFIACSNAVT